MRSAVDQHRDGAMWHFSREALEEAGARHGPPFAVISSQDMDLSIGRCVPGCCLRLLVPLGSRGSCCCPACLEMLELPSRRLLEEPLLLGKLACCPDPSALPAPPCCAPSSPHAGSGRCASTRGARARPC